MVERWDREKWDNRKWSARLQVHPDYWPTLPRTTYETRRHGSYAPCPRSPSGQHCYHKPHEYANIKRCCYCGKTQ